MKNPEIYRLIYLKKKKIPDNLNRGAAADEIFLCLFITCQA